MDGRISWTHRVPDHMPSCVFSWSQLTMVLRDGVVPPGLCLWTSSCMWLPNVFVVVERLVHVAAKDVLGVIVHMPLVLCPG